MLAFEKFCLPESGLDIFWMVLIGILSFAGQIGISLSAHFESAASLALLRKSFDVIFAFLFQIMFFQVSFHDAFYAYYDT